MIATRVLVVDDSATVRAVIRRMLDRADAIEVVGEAADGTAAVEAARRLRPDAVLMDIEMPELDGFEATRRIMESCPTAIIVLSSRVNREEMLTAFEAIRRGAVGVLAKPETPSEWTALESTLVATVRAVAHPSPGEEPAGRGGGHRGPDGSLRYVGVGASTGGPAAVRALLQALGSRFELGVAVVQHIAVGFEVGMADWLASELAIDVRVAREGESLDPGVVRIAPQGGHLRIDAEGRLAIDRASPARNGHRPSADELFLSLAAHWGPSSAGVLLSGMGDDGARGLASLRTAGGFTVVQDRRSCAVFGMPRAALDLKAAEIALPPAEIGRLLARGGGRVDGRGVGAG